MKTNFAGLLAMLAVVSGCSGASTTDQDAGVDAGPSFDGGPGTLWIHLWNDSVVGLDTRNGQEVKRFDAVGAAQGGDGVLALGGGALWFQGANGVRGLNLSSGVASDIPGASGGAYPAYGAGAVWWAEEGTLADPRPIFRFDPLTQATTHTNATGIPYGTGGLIAAGAEGCFSLYTVLSPPSGGVAHVAADGSTNVGISLPGGKVGLGASVAVGGGWAWVLANVTVTSVKRLYAIDSTNNTIASQRDLTTPEFGADGLLANEDHLLFAENTVWYVDAYGQKFYELDPATLATRRAVATGPTTKQAAIGAGGAWTGETNTLTRTDLATGTQVELRLGSNIRAMVFQAP